MNTPWIDIHQNNMWVILIVVIVIGFVGTWLWGSKGGPTNKTVIKGKKNKAINNQVDNSVRQTQIKTDAHVHLPPPPPPRPSAQQADDGGFFAGLAVVLGLVVAGLYVRYFESITIATAILYAFALGSGLALLGLAALNKLGSPDAVAYRATALTVVAAAGMWLLSDAQSLIDPRLVAAAQPLSVGIDGLIALVKIAWRSALWPSTLASTLMAVMCVVVAIKVLLLAWRIGAAGLAYRVMPSWDATASPLIGLLLVLAVRYLWLPHALTIAR
jgi:hypothetical protein